MLHRRILVGLCCLAAGVILPQLFGDDPPATPAPITGIENLRQVTPRILCGSQPESAESFAELARRGIKAVVTVDGAKPDIAAAHKSGLRYVHIPIRYGKIDPQQRADLVEAVKTAGGPVYIHCHHGKHRGPAAAAYCGMAIGELTKDQGLELLNAAGTLRDYTGLWDAIRQFEAPKIPAGQLVEVAKVEPIVAAMVRIDHHWTGLAKKLKAGPVEDAESREELLHLTEEFRELPRTVVTDDESLKKQMQQAQAAAEAVLKAVQSNASAADLKSATERMAQRCADCHAAHR